MKKTAKKKPSKPAKARPARMTGERLALEFLKLPLSEHFTFQKALSAYTIHGKLASAGNDLVSSSPNESLLLIHYRLKELLKAQGVHQKTIQRLLRATTGQMAQYREALIAIRYTQRNGRLYQSVSKRPLKPRGER
jgi:hypothetical protein